MKVCSPSGCRVSGNVSFSVIPGETLVKKSDTVPPSILFALTEFEEFSPFSLCSALIADGEAGFLFAPGSSETLGVLTPRRAASVCRAPPRATAAQLRALMNRRGTRVRSDRGSLARAQI